MSWLRWVRASMAALPSAVAATVCLVTWVSPYTFGKLMVRQLALVMLLEFIIVHASPFLGNAVLSKAPRGKKIKAILGLGVMYSLFASGMALAFERWWPLFVFWGLVFNKLVAVWWARAPLRKQQELFMAQWGAGAACYLLGCGLTTVLPVPALGITSAVRRAQDLPGTGLWIDEPHRVVAAGALYFLAMTIAHFVMTWKASVPACDSRTDPGQEKLSWVPTEENPSRAYSPPEDASVESQADAAPVSK